MRVLVACEFSGVVRDAFAKKGHYAVSCDYLPSERPDDMHHQGNVMDIIDDGWDLMIAHPPCTYAACVRYPLECDECYDVFEVRYE